jgi:hypothetical protein
MMARFSPRHQQASSQNYDEEERDTERAWFDECRLDQRPVQLRIR